MIKSSEQLMALFFNLLSKRTFFHECIQTSQTKMGKILSKKLESVINY